MYLHLRIFSYLQILIFLPNYSLRTSNNSRKKLLKFGKLTSSCIHYTHSVYYIGVTVYPSYNTQSIENNFMFIQVKEKVKLSLSNIQVRHFCISTRISAVILLMSHIKQTTINIICTMYILQSCPNHISHTNNICIQKQNIPRSMYQITFGMNLSLFLRIS